MRAGDGFRSLDHLEVRDKMTTSDGIVHLLVPLKYNRKQLWQRTCFLDPFSGFMSESAIRNAAGISAALSTSHRGSLPSGRHGGPCVTLAAVLQPLCPCLAALLQPFRKRCGILGRLCWILALARKERLLEHSQLPRGCDEAGHMAKSSPA